MGTENELLGKVPNQMSLQYINEHAEVYASRLELGIILSKSQMYLPEGQHAHESYEFLMLMSSPFSSMVEKTSYIMETNHLFPFNSEQYHGPKSEVNDFQSLCITVEKDYIDDITKTIFGKTGIDFDNKNYKIEDDTITLVNMFIEECKNKQAGYEFVIQSLASHITINLIRNIKNNMMNIPDEIKYSENQYIKRIIEYFNENYRCEFSMEDIAKIASYSPFHLIRVFKAQTGKTPYEYLMDIKVNKAKILLRSSKQSILEICYACGFNNPNHFSTVFKRRTGTSPSEYRKSFNL